MKHAKVKLNYYPICDKAKNGCLQHADHAEDGHPVAEYIMLENRDDLQAYAELLDNAGKQQITKCLNSPLFPQHVDHMLGARDAGSQLLAVAYYTASAHSLTHPEPHILNNPIYRIGEAAARKVQQLGKIIDAGNIPLIGSAGGYMWHDPPRTEILEVYDKKPSSGAPADVRRTGAKVIVLENDWNLPKESRRYLERVYGKTQLGQGKFSIVYDLRGHSHDELLDELKAHKLGGGDTVFVYTSGLDVPQMYDYTEAIIEAGIKGLVLYFTGDEPKDFDKYLAHFQGRLTIIVLDDLDA